MAERTRAAGQLGGTRPLTFGGDGALQLGAPPKDAYRVELSVGNRRTVLHPESVSIRLVHTGVSDVEVVVPNSGSMADWRFSEMNVYHGSALLFRSIAEQLPAPSTEATARIAGRGIGRTLARGGPDDDLTFVDRDAYNAIREVWDDWTEFDARVLVPDTPTRIGQDEAYEVGGTPLEILQDLHEKAGMRFTIDHQDPARKAESYVPREHPKTQTWTAIGWDADLDVQDYANKMTVVGDVKTDGTRASGSAVAQEEIEALAAELGISESAATVHWRLQVPSLKSDADCADRAATALDEHLEQDSLSGTVDIIPDTLVLPGYQYAIDEWSAPGESAKQLPVNEVEYSESLGDATGTLTVNAPGGQLLADLVGDQLGSE